MNASAFLTRALGRRLALALALAFPLLSLRAQLNTMAINQSFLDDWAGVIYADALQQTRAWTVAGGGAATVNSRGFPTQDAQSVLSGSMPLRAGTYRVYTNGTFNISFNSGSVTAFTNDAATGLKVATWTLTARKSNAIVTVSNLTVAPTVFKIMRPIDEGSTQTHAIDDVTDVGLAAILGTTKILRHMDALATNDNPSTTWASRIKPADNQVVAKDQGTPWEYIIELSNDTQTSPWINIPHKADDNYILKVAQMFRYGSDGTNPFTSDAARQAAIDAGQKVYYPLDSNLQVYIEYSNEVWNSQFGQTADVQALGLAEGNVSGTPLRYDGIPTTSNSYQRAMMNRYYVWRAVAASNAFRSVFGDAAMMTRIRPVLMWQVRNGNSHGSYRMNFLTEYYGKVNPGNPVARPPSYYFYAGGTALYYSPADPTTIDAAWTSGDFDLPTWTPRLVTDGALAIGAGLRYFAYEGGPGFGDPNGGAGEHPLSAQLSADPRLKNEIYEHHQAFSAAGGDVFCYYQLQGGIDAHKWTFVYHLDDPLTQRMTAYNTLATQNESAETVGTLLPATVNGGAFSVGAKADATAPSPAPSGSVTLAERQWGIYDVRSATAASYTVVAAYSGGATGAVLEFHLGDTKLGESAASGSGNTAAFTFTLAANKRSGLRVTARGGSVTVGTLTFAAASNSVPAITTTSLPGATVGAAYPSQTLAATGGNGTLVWSLGSGTLPAGLTLSSAGVISGTPTTAGTSNFTVRVADSDGVTGAADEDTQALSIVVSASADLMPVITTTSLPNGGTNVAYSHQLTSTPGDGTLTWTRVSGTLPTGITLSSSGLLSGTATAAVARTLTFRVTDADGDSDDQVLVLNIGTAVGAPSAPSNPVATANSATQVTLTWTDNASNETAFRVQRRVTGTTTWTTLSTTVAANATSYVDTTAASDTSYDYRVRAENATGFSAFTAVASVTTPVLIVTTTETFESVTLPTSYTSGSFTGDAGVVWNYVALRSSTLVGNAARLDKTSTGPGSLATTTSGLKSVVLKMASGTSGSSTRLRLVVNGVTIATSPLVDFSTTTTWTVSGLNYTGSTTVKIENDSDVVARVDDIEITR